MNPPTKLVAFLALLVAVFGMSYVAGTQSQALLAPVQIHNSEMVPPTAAVDGYALSAVEATQQAEDRAHVDDPRPRSHPR